MGIPKVAVREALLNAIVHKDYGATMPINIKVFDNKIVFINAGELPLGLNTSDLSIEHKSKPRNVLIAENFKEAKYIEVYGTGTLRIIEECKKAGLPLLNLFPVVEILKSYCIKINIL